MPSITYCKIKAQQPTFRMKKDVFRIDFLCVPYTNTMLKVLFISVCSSFRVDNVIKVDLLMKGFLVIWNVEKEWNIASVSFYDLELSIYIHAFVYERSM